MFVPWGLYGVVGEWHFLRHPADPTLVLGENIYMNDEWLTRSMYQDIPRNDLQCHKVDTNSFTVGQLEDWTAGALRLDGSKQYCEITDASLREDYDWEDLDEGTTGSYPGEKRKTVDMDSNDFLIELVFRSEPGHTGGTLVAKRAERGYVLDIGPDGSARLTLDFGTATYTRSTSQTLNDGSWHHLVAQVTRQGSAGIQLFVDGQPADGPAAGKMQAATASLSNTGDFLVGRSPGAETTYFAGTLDFLRVARGTLTAAKTTITELYRWQFDGPFLKDLYGHPPSGAGRYVGAVERD